MSWTEEKSHQKLEGTTVVHDLNSGHNVLWIEGVVTLPVGATVELHDPRTVNNENVTVERVRLLAAAGTYGPQVCLDVRVSDEWWEAVGGVE